jgi:cytochrome P450
MDHGVVAEIVRRNEHAADAGLAGDGIRFAEPVGAWLVHRYADVDRVLTDHEVFSSDELAHSAQPVPHQDNPVLGSLAAMDPPRHHVLRRLVSRAFTPRAVAALRPEIDRTVHALLDVTDGDTELSVIDQLGYPLSVGTIAALLGVDAERQADFVRWTEAITSFAGRFTEDPVRRREFHTARTELADYFRAVFADRRASPRDDVITTLLAAEPDGTCLTDDELVNFCTLLLVNGHETTTTLLTNTVLWLGEHPDALADVRARPDLIPGAVEEVLRLLPPVGGTDRFTTRPTTIAGQHIEAGQRVIAGVLAANRDPRVFAEPHRFEPRRDPNRHLSLGHGIHFCLGAHLARQEVGLALRAMLDRLAGPWHLPAERIATQRTPVGIDVLKLTLTWG